MSGTLGGTEVTQVRHTGRYGGHAGQAHWEVRKSHRSGTLGCVPPDNLYYCALQVVVRALHKTILCGPM